MPIAALECPLHAEIVQPSHFGPDACHYVTRQHADLTMTSLEGRPTKGVSATELLGCLRSAILPKYTDVTMDPLKLVKAQSGTMIHAGLGSNGHGRWRGMLGGIEVSGQCDGLSYRIIDFKSGKPPRQGVWKKDQVQVSIYNHIRPDGHEYTFEGGLIYYLGGDHSKADPCGRTCDFLSEEQILAYEVAPGWTVRDNIDLVKRHKFTDLPLTGESISMGKKTSCDYCPILRTCKE